MMGEISIEEESRHGFVVEFPCYTDYVKGVATLMSLAFPEKEIKKINQCVECDTLFFHMI